MAEEIESEGKKKPKKEGKRTKKAHRKMKKSSYYSFSAEKIERKKRFCPKCGPGTFMAEHKNRFACGKCAYTEFKQK